MKEFSACFVQSIKNTNYISYISGAPTITLTFPDDFP